MHTDLEARRRVLVLIYERYTEADRAWTIALQEMRGWFPRSSQPYRSAIGNPGSPIRRLYEQRARALQQLEVARMEYESMKRRLSREGTRIPILRITGRSG
ncbi:hypothetical protein ACW9UR_05460 [Halovulum sp. GXIMD14794]